MCNPRISLYVAACMSEGLAGVLARPVDGDGDGSDRASGLCVCDVCGLEYYDHPADPREPWMTIVCSGRRYKL